MSKVTVMNHPLISHKLAILRHKDTKSKDFRELLNEIASLMTFDICRDLKTKEVFESILNLGSGSAQPNISAIDVNNLLVKYNKTLVENFNNKLNPIFNKIINNTYTIQKLNRNENVNTDTLTKICKALNCTFDDIMDIVPDSEDWYAKDNGNNRKRNEG